MQEQVSTRSTVLSNGKILLLGILIYFLYLFILPKQSLDGDMQFWRRWVSFIYEHGLSSSYSSGTNYMPLFQYVFWIFGLTQNSVKAIGENIYMFKTFPLIFDFLGAYVICKWVLNQNEKWIFFLILILNPIFIYNSLLWGQVDAVHSFFVFVSCLAAIKGKIFPAVLSIFLAINFKLQAIIFIPFIGIILLPFILDKKGVLKFIYSIVGICILQILIILPFWLYGDLDKVISTVKGSADNVGSLSANAYNIWQWIVGGYTYLIQDNIVLWGKTAKFWGLATFCLFSFILLFPLLLYQFRNEQRNKLVLESGSFLNLLLITGALINMNFFFFCTQMHERYSHPTLIFVSAYAIRNKKWHLIGIFYLAYFLNLEKILRYLNWENYDTFIFDPRFVAGLFFIFMVLMYKDLFKIYSTKSESSS